VPEHARGARHALAFEKDGVVTHVAAPCALLDGSRRVDDRQLEVGPFREAVEHPRPVRGRLGEHDRETERPVVGQPAEALRSGALGAGGASPREATQRAERQRRVECESRTDQRSALRLRARAPEESPGRGAAPLSSAAPCVEGIGQLAKRVDSLLRRAHRNWESASRKPRELGALAGEMRREPLDLAHRHPAPTLELKLRPSRRGLPLVPTVEDERGRDVVAVGDFEEPCPEVVVLALPEGRVVPKPMPLEDPPVDDHGGMEER
jgi:hypothetical protein